MDQIPFRHWRIYLIVFDVCCVFKQNNENVSSVAIGRQCGGGTSHTHTHTHTHTRTRTYFLPSRFFPHGQVYEFNHDD